MVTVVLTLGETITQVPCGLKRKFKSEGRNFMRVNFQSNLEGKLIAEEPYSGLNLKRGRDNLPGQSSKYPEEMKGQESYCLVYWVKPVIDV